MAKGLSEAKGVYQHLSMEARGAVGVDLGELRELIAASEALPDKAMVFVGGLTQRDGDSSKFWAKKVYVENYERADR